MTLRPGFPIRISTDQSLLAAPRGFSQRATSFIASWRQGIHQMPFSRLSFLALEAEGSIRRPPEDSQRSIPGTRLEVTQRRQLLRTSPIPSRRFPGRQGQGAMRKTRQKVINTSHAMRLNAKHNRTIT